MSSINNFTGANVNINTPDVDASSVLNKIDPKVNETSRVDDIQLG